MGYVRDEPGDRALLAAAFAQAPHGVVVLDRAYRYVAVNERLAASNNAPLAAHVGHTVADVVPGSWPMLEPIYARVLAGEEVTQTWTDVWVEHTGSTGSARATFVPVRVADEQGEPRVEGIAVVFTDVTEETRLRRRTDRLRDLGSALAASRTRADIARATLRLAEEELGATTVVLAAVDESHREVVTTVAGTQAAPGEVERVPLSFDAPPTHVLRTGEELVLRDRAEHDARWPAGAGAAAADRGETSVTLPLRDEGGLVGALGVSWQTVRPIDDDALTYLRALATRTASALARRLALEREQRAVELSQALMAAATRVNSLVDEHEVATEIASVVVALTDAGEAGVYLVDADEGDLVRIDRGPAIDPERRQKYDRLPLDGTTPVGAATASASPLWLQTEQDWERFPPVLTDVAEMHFPTVACLPLTTAGPDGRPAAPFGALYAHYPGPRRLLGDDREFLRTVAELAASALRRIRVQTERDRLSRAVQAALFPRLDTTRAGWQVQVAYRPGDDRMALGGDFYDAVTLGDGRLAVVIGDVTGHGPASAAAGSALRAAWRSLVMAEHPLDDLPAHLSTLLLSERLDDLLCATLLTVLLQPDGSAHALCLGHPGPLRITAGGVLPVPMRHQVFLGAPLVEPAVISHFTLAPDERLLLYTDGLVEGRAAPDSPERLGVDRFVSLVAALGQVTGPQAIIDEVTQRHGEGLPDDAAAVLLGPATGTVPAGSPRRRSASPTAQAEVRDGPDRLHEAAQRPERLGAPHLVRGSLREVDERRNRESELHRHQHQQPGPLGRGQVTPPSCPHSLDRSR